ncbi:SDR family NAD(P)-dependent oxidoreductase [Nocardia panacis]|uniref:SDR family NAD(P)-dependent oxidoreductase n=1 Tax=Nocardia panacis TaxID=2340916 RepID=A0A3A4K1P3_9NOCA|nr:SDR family NAD(P)-dependent oxidoreductase [Nocardia panacis]RJO70037.1 SDR family NAD(P)-dependent oxidoreductase [Nocardia panacis]
MPTAVVIGVGPGLGMSIAHRFGREGFAVALISRTADRHPGYLSTLASAGIEARALTADVRDTEALRAALTDIGPADVVYYGPANMGQNAHLGPIAETGAESVRGAMSWMYPAVETAQAVLPSMLEKGSGALFFAGGLSSVLPMPQLGALAVSSAALRNYALTLHAGVAENGIYIGTLTIGGLIERGDIHQHVTAHPETYGDTTGHTLDPDAVAEIAWRLYRERDRAEEVFNVFS